MTTLAEINQLVEQLDIFETKIASARNTLKALDEGAEEIRRKILGVLAESGLKSFKAGKGTVTAATRFGVKFPKDPDVKEQLRQYLTEKQAFDGMWSINHQTLNSWYKAKVEEAQGAGEYLDVPGLEPTSDTILQFRRGANQ